MKTKRNPRVPGTRVSRPSPTEIRVARTYVGESQANAAAAVHVDQRTWKRWEYGERKMPLAAWELYLIKNEIGYDSKTLQLA